MRETRGQSSTPSTATPSQVIARSFGMPRRSKYEMCPNAGKSRILLAMLIARRVANCRIGGRRIEELALPNGPGIELPARECTTAHRPDAGESSRVTHPAVAGGRQLGALVGRVMAGQLQCLVRRRANTEVASRTATGALGQRGKGMLPKGNQTAGQIEQR